MALGLCSCSKYKYEEVKGDLAKTRIYTLDNGLKVYLSVNKEQPRIQTYIAVRTGSKNDPAETTGLAHYLEHLMFKGTTHFGVTDAEKEAPLLDDIEQRYENYRLLTDPEERRKAYHEIDSVSQVAAQYFIPNEYDKLMSAIGSEGSNAFTSNDVTCYVEDIPSNEVENWAKIQADRFMNMVIRGFHTELEAVYEEYNMGLSEDMNKLYEALGRKLCPTHPYGTQTTIGTQEHLKNPSIRNIKQYFQKWYVPNNVAICMAGDFDPDEVIATIDKYFGQWRKGGDVTQPQFPEQPVYTEPQDTAVIGPEAETLWLGWRFDRAASLQTDTLEVIESMLSNGTAGLLDLDINQQMKMLQSWGAAQPLMDYSVFILAGTPKDGQSLDEVRQLLLGEVEKLKKGDFSDDLLPSVVNNLKLQYYNALEVNRARAHMFMDAFINGTPWEQQVQRLDRLAGMTKEQIVDFARRHFTDGYAAVYKRQGTDPNEKKIDKPAITPIAANRDNVSQFVKDIQAAEVKPIEPKFVDFQKDLSRGKLQGTEASVPYAYVQNTENGRFQLSMRYEFGKQADVRYDYAADYLEYLGTDSLTAQQLKQQFYKLACHYNIEVGDRVITVSLNGLSENMTQAVALLENLMANAKADQQAYDQYVSIVEKSRADAKHEQSECFGRLMDYAVYGPYNPSRNILSTEQLRQTKPEELLELLKNLRGYDHTVLYYGPMNERELADALKPHLAGFDGALKPVPANKPYVTLATPENEVLIAPYNAKNIYLRMYHNEQRQWNPAEEPVQMLFNEYFGGGMNTIVFQEMRETRGLAYNAWALYHRPELKGEVEDFFTHIITQNDKMMDCISHFNAILDTIPQSESSFQIAKDALMKRLASQRTTKFGIISAWLMARDLGLDYDINRSVYDALPGLTMKDVVDFEQQQIARKPYRYVILGDEKELDMAALKPYGSVRRLTIADIFGY